MTREQEAKWRAAIKPLILEMHKQGMTFAEIDIADIKNVIVRISADALDVGDKVESSSTEAGSGEQTGKVADGERA